MSTYSVQKEIDGQWVDVVSTTSKFCAEQEADYWGGTVGLSVRIIVSMREEGAKWEAGGRW